GAEGARSAMVVRRRKAGTILALTLVSILGVLPATARAYSTATIAVGRQPIALAANPRTNTIYVANFYPVTNGSVTEINGATDTTRSIAVGLFPDGVGVNPVTNRIYVANSYDDTITVVDGATNATRTLPGGAYPYAVAVNATTNKVYVTDYEG